MATGTTDIQDIAATESINRAAFPAYKVFIYGKDVSADVMSVRINQSGGSIERSPMTCAITLQNLQDKYVLNRKDIGQIGRSKSLLSEYWDYRADALNDEHGFSVTLHNVMSEGPKIDEAGNVRVDGKYNLNFPLGGRNVTIDSAVVRQLGPKLAQASDEERTYILRAYLGSQGRYELTLSDANAITSAITKAIAFLDRNELRGDTFDSYREESLGYDLKQQVIHEKLEYTANIKPKNTDNSLLNYEDRLVFDYPMQEGDCIFHANDPVRVALRDPFDPRIWYWSFTGFIDTWTEDTGVNFDSEITITCTDVSKMVRYAVVQLKTGLLDPNLDSYLEGLRNQGGQTAANSDLILTKEIFEGLSLIEIMETVFFGSQSALDRIDQRVFAELNSLQNLDEVELRDYFMTTFNLTLEKAVEYVPYGLTDNPYWTENPYGVDAEPAEWTKIKNKVTDSLKSKAKARFNALNWQGITSPRDVSFKRASDANGIHFYVLGSPSDTDAYFGATEVEDLFNWNEIIHHRVRRSDLKTMRTSSYTGSSTNQSIDQIIYQIGTDLDNYPVGGGRVFYMAPAKMDTVIGNGVLDHAFGGVGSMHSTFRDRLSYLYDLADIVDFRFYATPRGDVIFEMPFYDYDPDEFWKSKDVQTNGMDRSKLDEDYETIFQQQYSGDYTNDEWEDLTEMAIAKNTENIDLIDYNSPPVFDYKRSFSIETHEQSGFSNTMSDRGMITAYRVKANYIDNYRELQNEDVQVYKWAIAKSLIPSLGVRVDEGNMWGFVKGEEAAELYAALELNRTNAEARNVGIQTIPKFGLMVNRPIHWKYRNYYANIVSISHSVVWNSDVNTSVNVNQIRGWSGEIDWQAQKLVHRHFGDTDRPFNLAEFLKKAQTKDKQRMKTGVDQADTATTKPSQADLNEVSINASLIRSR